MHEAKNHNGNPGRWVAVMVSINRLESLGVLQPLRGEDSRLVRYCSDLYSLVGSMGRFTFV